MSKISDALRQRGIHNTHGLLLAFGAEGKDFAICFTPHSRQTMSSFGVYIYCPRGRLKARFSYHYRAGREEAKAFAAQHFGITEWVTAPTDRTTLLPKYVLDAAKHFLKEEA